MKKGFLILGAVIAALALVWGGVGFYFSHDLSKTINSEGGANGSVVTKDLNTESAKKSQEDKFSFLHSDDYYQGDQYTSWQASYMITNALGDDKQNNGKIADVSPDYAQTMDSVSRWFPWMKDDASKLHDYVNQEPINVDDTRDSFTAHEIEYGCDARKDGEKAEEQFFQERDAKFSGVEKGKEDVRTTRWVSVLYGMDEVCPAGKVSHVESKETSK